MTAIHLYLQGMSERARLPIEVEERLTAAWHWWVAWCSRQLPVVRPMRPTRGQACDAIIDRRSEGATQEEVGWLARALALGTRTVRDADIGGIAEWAARGRQRW